MSPQDAGPVVADTLGPAGILQITFAHKVLCDPAELKEEDLRLRCVHWTTFHELCSLQEVLAVMLRFLMNLVRADVLVEYHVIALCRGSSISTYCIALGGQ